MDEPILMLVHVEGDSSTAWWQGPCPWPGLPTVYAPDPMADRMSWRCCPDGAIGMIIEVELHLPKPGQAAFTMTVCVERGGLGHLVDAHGFVPASPDQCDAHGFVPASPDQCAAAGA